MIRSLDGQAPAVDPTAFVHERAEVIGKVRLGAQASVWPGAVLRGDIEEIVLGARSNAQDNAVFHTDKGHPTVLGEGVTVGHAAVLHGCTVGNNCLIGMGAILLNGVVVEDEVLVGAGALLTPGTRVPKGHLAVGSPAKVIRPLKPEEIKHIYQNAENYIGYSQRHAQTSKPVR